MDAQEKGKRAVPSSSSAARRYLATVEEFGESGKSAQAMTANQVVASDKARKKRSRSETSESPDVATSQRSPSKHTQYERASKKARLDNTELEFIILSVCLKRLERVQIQSGRFQPMASTQDLYLASIRTLLHHLKTLSPDAYNEHLGSLATAYANWDVAHQDKLDDSAHPQADQGIIDVAMAFFDCDSLIQLHPHLTGNVRLRTLLRNLQLPLQDLRKAASTETVAQQGRQAAAKDLLAWLSPPEPYPSTPEMPTYNDLAARSKVEEVMRVEVDQAALLEQDAARLHESNGRAEFLLKQASVSVPSQDEQSQHQPERRDQVTIPQPSQAPSVPQATAEPPNPETAMVIFDQVAAAGQQQSMWSPEDQAALMNAGSQPHEKAHAHAILRAQQARAQYEKLHVWGEAYNIIIEQLILAETTGSSPAHVADLKMPDADACYYRLQDLWDKIGHILHVHEDFSHLLTNGDKFYRFAIAMREVHCLLRVVNCYGWTYADILATGWELDKMRRLQVMMADHVHEGPLVFSKPDVDAVCSALQQASVTKAAVEQCGPVSFAERVGAAAQAAVPQFTGAVNNGGQRVAQQQAGNGANVQQGQGVARNQMQPAQVQHNAGYPTQQMQATTPVQQTPYVNDYVDLMDTDNASRARMPQIHFDTKGLDPSIADNYCNNWAAGRCKNRKCKRIHAHIPPEFLAQPTRLNVQTNPQNTNPQQEAAPQPQTGPPPRLCKFFSQGRCTSGNTCHYSHDPALLASSHQPTGDATMGGAASNGDNDNHPTRAAAPRTDKFNRPCRNEANGRFCNNAACSFNHVNTRSKNFANANGNGNQHQGGPRAPNDHTYDPARHNVADLRDLLPHDREPEDDEDEEAEVDGWTQQLAQMMAPRPAEGLMGPPPLPAYARGDGSGNGHGSGSGSGSGGNGHGQQPTCYSCHEVGHKSPQCPHKHNGGGGRRQGGGQRRGSHNQNPYPGQGLGGGDQNRAGQHGHQHANHHANQHGNHHANQNGNHHANNHSNTPSSKTCFLCGRPGHVQNACPQRQQQQQQQQQRSAQRGSLRGGGRGRQGGRGGHGGHGGRGGGRQGNRGQQGSGWSDGSGGSGGNAGGNAGYAPSYTAFL